MSDTPRVDLPVEGKQPERIVFPKGATAKDIADAINAAWAANDFGSTFSDNKKK